MVKILQIFLRNDTNEIYQDLTRRSRYVIITNIDNKKPAYLVHYYKFYRNELFERKLYITKLGIYYVFSGVSNQHIRYMSFI